MRGSRLAAVLLARLANASVVAFDYEALGRYLGQLVARVGTDSTAVGVTGELAQLAAAAARLEASGRAFNAARDRSVERVAPAPAVTRMHAAANASLRQVERALTRPTGLIGRPNMRNLVMASDRDNGYSNIPLPGIDEALRDRDVERARREIRDLRTNRSRGECGGRRNDRAGGRSS